jgi:hypothetical protein
MVVDEVINRARAIQFSAAALPAAPGGVGGGEVNKGRLVAVDACCIVEVVNGSCIRGKVVLPEHVHIGAIWHVRVLPVSIVLKCDIGQEGLGIE